MVVELLDAVEVVPGFELVAEALSKAFTLVRPVWRHSAVTCLNGVAGVRGVRPDPGS